jgi:26S proteasome regulatory subunit T5
VTLILPLKIFKSEVQRLQHEEATMKEKIKDNQTKIKNNRQLPYLVSNVVEVFIRLLL